MRPFSTRHLPWMALLLTACSGGSAEQASHEIADESLFAGKDAYIATFEGRPTERDGMHVLWVLEWDGTEVGIEGRNALRFLNHSSRPNAEFLGPDLHATRNIQPGQEITFHYGDEWDDVD